LQAYLFHRPWYALTPTATTLEDLIGMHKVMQQNLLLPDTMREGCLLYSILKLRRFFTKNAPTKLFLKVIIF